jgi:hypothetical protein
MYFSPPPGDYRDMKLRGIVLLLFAIVALQAAAGEYQTKAAYLHRFAQFVEWPENVLAPRAPIVIGVVGDDPFGRGIDEAMAGKLANGHPFAVRRLRWNDALTSCHILFIAASELGHLRAILDATRGSSVLTVGDSDSFTEAGGMIELKTIENRIEFDINTAAAEVAHITISSKLLQIARAIRGTVEGR